MEIKTSTDLIKEWFEKWEEGDFENLPVSNDFIHESPFGEIKGKSTYLDLVRKNKEKFLGYKFLIQDAIYEKDKACVRYRGVQDEMTLDVSEWYYFAANQINKIIAYYHIGEIRKERILD